MIALHRSFIDSVGAFASVRAAFGNGLQIHLKIQDCRHQHEVQSGLDGARAIGETAILRHPAGERFRPGMKAQGIFVGAGQELRAFENRIAIGRAVIGRPVFCKIPKLLRVGHKMRAVFVIGRTG